MEVGIFDLEVREKKNQAYLNKQKTGSRGGSKGRKGMRTPYDSMTLKEKRKLNGEVQVTMYETILTYDEFILKDESLQKTLLTRWREIYDNQKIKAEMQMSNASFYKLVSSLGLASKKGVSRPRKAKGVAKVEEVKTEALAPNVEPQIKPLLISRGLHLEYNGEYSPDQLQKIFTKLSLLTEGEENHFTVSISLTERT
jgi:hypothetical protein